MSKKSIPIGEIALALGLGGLFLNLIKQGVEIEDGTKEEFSWGEFAKWGLGGAGLGLGLGVGIAIIMDLVEEDEEGNKRFRETRYLRSVLQSHDPRDTDEANFQKRKVQEIVSYLEDEFGGINYRPEISGSMGKGTANAGTSDMDLLVPFPKYAFGSLPEMYEATFDVLKSMYAEDPEVIEVRRQRVSIGLRCRANGIETRIDIVPGKEQTDYLQNKSLSLHVKGNWWEDDVKYIKTNIHKHKEILQGSASKKDVVRLLKIWGAKVDAGVKGFEWELMVSKAYDYYTGNLPRTLFGRLLYTLRYIHEKVETATFRDPAVQSNRVFEDEDRRRRLKRRCGELLQDVAEDRTQLAHYFPLRDV